MFPTSARIPFAVAVVSTIFIALFIGKFHLYQVMPNLDTYFHFLIGGVVVGWFFKMYFAEDFQSGSKLHYLVAVIGAAALVGVCWEFVERLSSVYGSPGLKYYLYGGDIIDTLTDLTADIAGAVVGALLIKKP